MITAKRPFGENLEFRSAADVLRWLSENTSQYGQRQPLERTFLTAPERHGAYHLKQDRRLELSEDDYAHVYRVLTRYQAFCKHMAEVDPEWVDKEKIPYMDNSVELIQESRKYPGRTRRVTLVAPHGDACF